MASYTSATLSVRLLWPVARVLSEPGSAHLPRFPGIELENFGNPEARFPHDVVMRALEACSGPSGDPLIGLRAGEQFDQADFDILEYAARATSNFGQAMAVVARYLRVMHEAIEARVVVEDGHAMWRVRTTDGVRQPPAANDYIVACAIAFSRRNVAVPAAPVEIWLAHSRPAYASEYERRYQTKVRFDAPCNAIVMAPSRLEAPMRHSSPELSGAFEVQVQRMLDKLRHSDGLPGRVRWEVADQLRAGSASMEKTARKLAMGVTTLRRKLEEEGTTFSDIVDELRKELAERHLAGSHSSVSEIAFLLGFSDVRAFGRAFRRWKGQSPTEFRALNRS
jgi:AraC-like DNA-binding protein